MKRIISYLFIFLLAIAIVGCKDNDSSNKDELLVYTFTDELKEMIELLYLRDNPDLDYDIKIVVVETNSFQEAVDPLLSSGKNAPDVIALEAAFVRKYVESDYLMDLSDLGEDGDVDLKDEIIPYTIEVGTDFDGKIKGLSWQATPGAFFYRRSIAEDVLGIANDENQPDAIQALFDGEDGSDKWENFFNVAKDLKEADVPIISSLGDLTNVFYANRDSAWVEDGKLVVDPILDDVLTYGREIVENEYCAEATQWEDSWFTGMNGTEDVFGYFLPTWGLHYTLKPNSGGEDGTWGDWGMVTGPAPYFWGGTWVGVREGTKMEDEARHLVEYLTLNESFLKKWAVITGDVVSHKGVLDEIKGIYSESFLDGQNHYEVFAEAALGVDASNLTALDQDIQALFQDVLTQYSNNTSGYATIEAALTKFKEKVGDSVSDVEVD